MAMGGLYFGWLAVLPFYLLEILVGLVQALVFALLCAVFTALMCEKHDDHAHTEQFRRRTMGNPWRRWEQLNKRKYYVGNVSSSSP